MLTDLIPVTTYPVYESDSLGLLCAFEGGSCGKSMSLTGGNGIVEGTHLPVSDATDGSCLPNTSMVVEWMTTNLTLRRLMNGQEIACNINNSAGLPQSISSYTELDVQCKFNVVNTDIFYLDKY